MGKEVYLSDYTLDILCQYGADTDGFGVNKAVHNIYKHINELKNKEEMARFEASYVRNKDLMDRLAKKYEAGSTMRKCGVVHRTCR